MSRDRKAGVTPPGTKLPELTAKPLLPLALLSAAGLAAFLASHEVLPAWLTALALLLATAGALVSGAYWSRQRQLDRLRDARMQHQLLSQLVGCWQWQTDAEHRLTRFQPPQGAPASAWVEGAFSGEPLWDRFTDAEGSLRPRLQAQTPLTDLRVRQSTSDGPARSWRLRGLPRFDGRGRFQGYLGVAEPTAHEDTQGALLGALSTLLADGPALLLHLVRGAQGWQLQQASPPARTLLGLSAGDLPAPWDQALGPLPDGLQAALARPLAGRNAVTDGWQWRWLPLAPQSVDDAAGEPGTEAPTAQAKGGGPGGDAAGAPDAGAEPAANGSTLLLALLPSDSAGDNATRALAAEHAAFSYTISHDLRAPIRVVEGFGRILKEDYGAQLDRIGRDHLDRVVSAAARMNHMIDALLSLSQLSTQPLARQVVNLSQLAGYVVDELRRGAPERQVAVHIAPDLSAVGDPTLLRMALENLLGNAWKYSAKATQAEIRFEQVSHAGRPAYRVADNGAGFDMRFADKLFGMFQRLHSASEFQGTGVGLASVRRIVRRHGGEVWAESAPGAGARFYFTLKA